MPNQSEVNAIDMYLRRNRQQEVVDRLQKISNSLHCDFLKLNHLKELVPSTKNCRVISSSLGDLIPDFNYWNELDGICRIHNKKIWMVTDNLINQHRYSFENIRILSFPQLLGIGAQSDMQIDPPTTPSRLYNCFMQRCESVRQSWFYFLWLEGLLEKGYVSYLLYQLDAYNELTGAELFDFIHHNNGLDRLEKFQEAYQALRPNVPYKNFEENFNLVTYINDSKYSVILESYSIDDDRYQWCFTEKLLRSLQANTINLVFAQKHSIKQLKDLGLEVDEINQQWDGDDWTIRQRKILEVLKTDSVSFNAKLQKDRREHNRNLLHSWKNEYHDPRFFDSMAEEISSS